MAVVAASVNETLRRYARRAERLSAISALARATARENSWKRSPS